MAPTLTFRLAVLNACDVLVGLKTTLITQLSPAPSVVPAQVESGLGWMLKLAVLGPVIVPL